MTAQYFSVFTEQGLSLLREAIQNGTKLGITKMSFGDGGGSLPYPDATFTQLVNEVYETQLNSLAPDPNNSNWLRAEAVISSAIGGFNIRELGLWADDILVAYSNYPPTYKPNPSDGTARIMTFRMVLQIDNTANFELKIDADIVMATIRTVEEAKQDAIKYADNTKVHSLESLTELANVPAWHGRIVYIKSVIENKSIGGGSFSYDAESTLAPDGFVVIGSGMKGRWIKVGIASLTLDDFGALGDGINDDSDAFNNYCKSPYTNTNIVFPKRRSVFLIKKQVDCKLKGIVGHGFSRQSAVYYDHSSITVDPTGDFSNADPELANFAFINVGAELRDLQFRCLSNTTTISGMLIGGYNTTLSNVNLAGFFNQVHIKGITVSFRVTDLMAIGATGNSFYIEDKESKQSTTAYFKRCSWQWLNCPVKFEKDVYGSSFEDIIIEYTNEGLTAAVWSNCTFDNIWAEETRHGEARDWLVNTSYQQSFNNIYGALYIRSPWLNRADTNALAGSDNTGGVVIDKSRITLNGSTGAKIALSPSGISTLFANWIGGINRRLLITTQATAENSGYKTPIHINAPNNELYFGNQDEASTTPVIFKRVIGATATNTPYVASDAWTKNIRKWHTYNHEVSKVGRFIAPMALTYDSTLATQQNNAGWSIVKESTGMYKLQKDVGVTTVLKDPNITVSGCFYGAGVGGSAPLLPAFQAIESYEGSFNTYRELAGVRIFFTNLDKALSDPRRFTVLFTLESGL